jgi:hypothetical protein
LGGEGDAPREEEKIDGLFEILYTPDALGFAIRRALAFGPVSCGHIEFR